MNYFDLSPEVIKEVQAELSKAPAEDLTAVYTDIFKQFVELRKKLYAGNKEERDAMFQAMEQLKIEIQARMTELYKNVGVDFNDLVKLVNKKINNQEHSVII